MKKRKLKVLASLFLAGAASLGMASCNDNNSVETKAVETGKGTTETNKETGKETNTNTPDPTPVVVTVSSIAVKGGKRDYKVGETFSKEGLVVTATMSDKTTKEVTEFEVDSSAVKLDTAGTYQVVVKYQGKQVTYDVTVSAPVVVTQILLLTDNCQTEFTIGDAFSYEGLEVVAEKSDGSNETVTNFEVKLYEDEALTVEATELSQIKTYYVKVSALDKFDKYEIIVENEKYTVVNEFNVNDKATTKIYNVQDEVVYEKDGAKITAQVSGTKYAKVAGSAINYVDDKVTRPFVNRITLDGVGDATKCCFKIELDKPMTVNIYGKTGSKGAERFFMLTNQGDYSQQIKLGDDIQRYTYNLKAGTYYLYGLKVEGGSNGSTHLYGIDFCYKVDKSTLTYSAITLDTTNVKKDYNLGDTLDTTGLVVKGLNNFGNYDVLTDVTVSDVDLQTPGIKDVTVKYGEELTAIYQIQVIALDAKTQELTVTKAAKNLAFKKGSEFNAEGLVVTSKDQYNVTQDLNKDSEGLAIKVFQGENDVTETFTTLEKGKYTVEITYDDCKTTYEISILDVEGFKFEAPEQVAVGASKVASKLILSYGNGTSEKFESFDDVILSTTEGYAQTFYSDTNGTEASLDSLTAQEGVMYAKFSYGTYESELFTINVVVVNSDSYSPSALTKGTDYKGQTLYDGLLITVKVGSGTCKADSNKEINGGEIQIKLDDGANKEIQVTAKQDVTLKFIINASGPKTYKIMNSNGTTADLTGPVKKDASSNTEVVVTAKAGETITLTSAGGGVRFAGVVAEIA